MDINLNNAKQIVSDKVLDLWDYFKYDIFKERLQPPLVDFPRVDFKYDTGKDGRIYGISTNVQGFVFTADNEENLPDAIFDTLTVYYDIPRYQAKTLKNNIKVDLTNGKVIYKKEGNNKFKYS